MTAFDLVLLLALPALILWAGWRLDQYENKLERRAEREATTARSPREADPPA